MKISKNLILLLVVTFFFLHESNAQEKKSKWFLSFDVGVQMSGIKSEDFISSNYSPLIRITGGKWFNKYLGAQVGYQGRYFNTIENSDKRFYNFYFVEGLLDAKNILKIESNSQKIYELLFHLGFGYFQNQYYKNSTVHGILGTSNNFSLTKRVKLKFDIGAIIGWDIYQGNDDILPSLSLGTLYTF